MNVLVPSQLKVLQELKEASSNVLLTGMTGTGKKTVMKEFITQLFGVVTVNCLNIQSDKVKQAARLYIPDLAKFIELPEAMKIIEDLLSDSTKQVFITIDVVDSIANQKVTDLISSHNLQVIQTPMITSASEVRAIWRNRIAELNLTNWLKESTDIDYSDYVDALTQYDLRRSYLEQGLYAIDLIAVCHRRALDKTADDIFNGLLNGDFN